MPRAWDYLLVFALLFLACAVGYQVGLRDGAPRTPMPPDDGAAWSCWAIRRAGQRATICCRPQGSGQYCRED